jgi:hypothetical protein
MGTTRKRRGIIFDGGNEGDARDEPWRDEKEERKERGTGRDEPRGIRHVDRSPAT